MHMLRSAWQNVKQVSIINCFAKAGDNPSVGMTLSKFYCFVDMNMFLKCHGELTDDNIGN